METEIALLTRIAEALQPEGERFEHPRRRAAREIASRLVQNAVAVHPEVGVRNAVRRYLEEGNAFASINSGTAEPALWQWIRAKRGEPDPERVDWLDDAIKSLQDWILEQPDFTTTRLEAALKAEIG